MLHLLLALLLVLITTSRAATTNTMASVGASVAGNVPYYTDTSGQLLAPLSTSFYSGAMLTPWVATNNNLTLKWKKTPQVWEYGGAAAGEWTAFTFNSGSASLAPTPPDALEFGLWTASTGTLTNGGSGFRLNTTAGIPSALGSMAVMWRIKTPAALSSDADGYELPIGFCDTATDASQADGAYIYYTHSVSNGVWVARTVNNGAATLASGAASTVTVTADAWWNLLVELSPTVANFWVSSDHGVSWTWIGFSTANIPSTTSRSFGVQASVRKLGPNPTGTTARILSLGRCEFWPY